jgi:hypothetical protein
MREKTIKVNMALFLEAQSLRARIESDLHCKARNNNNILININRKENSSKNSMKNG